MIRTISIQLISAVSLVLQLIHVRLCLIDAGIFVK
jgi:hypothetical protein